MVKSFNFNNSINTTNTCILNYSRAILAGKSMRNNRDIVMTILNAAEINQHKNYETNEQKMKK